MSNQTYQDKYQRGSSDTTGANTADSRNSDVERKRVPVPGPDFDVRPDTGMNERMRKYMQGDVQPVTSSVLISNSLYLNNPYYREAYVTQALRRYGRDLPPTYMVPLMYRAINEVTDLDRLEVLIEEEIKKNPEFGAWFDEARYTSFTRDNTAKYEPGTLGHAINKFLSIPGMDIEFASRDESAETKAGYFRKRAGASHDIEHIVTGFGANTAGESALAMANVAVAAHYFTPELAQHLTHSQVWITTTSYNRMALHYHHVLPTVLDAMKQGIEVGQRLKKPMFMVAWEDYLDRLLEDIAAELGFQRGPGAQWDWTTEAAMD